MKKLIFSLILTIVLIGLVPIPVRAGESKHPFSVPTAKAIAHVKELASVSGKMIEIHGDEAKLFSDAATGKLSTFSFAEAALIASGAADPTIRKKYVEQIDRIEVDARKALEEVAKIAEKGERLLKFLHAGPMAKGYLATQTDVTEVLDSGRFNCVSSTVLYNVIARRLGLDVKAIEIPGRGYGEGHVFSVLYDGDKKIPVETTNANGFNLSDNMKKKDKRELGELALIAVIYYNHGVNLGKKEHHHEALLANLCALSLDKHHASASNNVMAELIQWELGLAKIEKHSEALEVLRVGLALAPKDAKLLNNRKVLIQDIVMKETKAGKFADALRRIEQHKALLADPQHVRRLTLYVIDTQAEELRRQMAWEKVIAVYATALEKLPGDSHIKNNMVASYDAWAQTHMQKSDWAGAIRVYERGLERLPGNSHFKHNMKYCQEQMAR